jgi:hypothetical protein
LNPPPLEDGDARAMAFYMENATAFVQEFGLMPSEFERLGLEGVCRRVFKAKLSKIHETVLRMRDEELKKRSK